MRTAATGWILLIGWGLLAGEAAGQQLSGALSLTGTAGYQSNLYLDPVLGEWDSDVDPAFLAFDPTVALAYSTSDWQFGLRGMARTYPRRMERSTVPLVRVSGSGRYAPAASWTLGLYGGASRYRLGAERDTWWILPAAEWRAGPRSTVELRAGVAGRRNTFSTGEAARQTSLVGVLRGSTWLTARIRGQVSLYRSAGRAPDGATAYGGSGLTAAATTWWTDRLALTAHLAFERIGYEVTREEEAGGGPPAPIGGPPDASTATTTTLADRLWRAGAEANWTLPSGLTLFARVQGMVADLEAAGTSSLDGHVGVGLRWRLARTLAGGRRSPPARELWRNVAEGLRFRVRYEGAGQLYVTGDFNDWADPGVPLRREGPRRYAVTLPLEPGRYEYRIRVVEGEETRWLDLPAAARTVRDGFGGVNGVCIVE
mgnify:CR=1 FL=1